MICGVQYAALLMSLTIFRKQYNIKINGDNYPAGGVFALLNIFTENVEVLEFQLKTSFLRQLREWSNVLGLSDSCTFKEFSASLLFARNC